MTKLLVERKCAEREDTAKLVDAIFANRQDYWICGEKVHIWLQSHGSNRDGQVFGRIE